MTGQQQAALEDTLLTMDIVDQLRHEQAILDSHANTEGQLASLKEKLSRVYRQQGIQVTEELLEEGVRAKLEGRFIHKPATGFQVALARFYIDRLMWAKRVVMTIPVGAAAVALYLAVFVYPEIRAANQFNSDIDVATQRLTALNASLAEVGVDLNSHSLDPDGRVAPTIISLMTQSREHRDDASKVAETLSAPVLAYVDRETLAANRDGLQSQLDAINGKLGEAEIAVDNAEAGIDTAGNLASLYREWSAISKLLSEKTFTPSYRSSLAAQESAALSALIAADVPGARRSITKLATAINDFETITSLGEEALALQELGVQEAKSDRDKGTIKSQYQLVASAIEASDLPGARVAMADLRSTVSTLLETYDISIVQEDGERSGVWRQHSENRSIRNYYLIVTAKNRAGRQMRLPIRNEETGRVDRVTKWGVRVSEAAFEKVKADKMDNRLIDNPAAGIKVRGEIEPKWVIDAIGGYITRW